MTDRRPDRLDEMKEFFLQAAAQEIERNPAPRRRPRTTRLAVALVALLIGAGGFATATGVIPIGKESNNRNEFNSIRPAHPPTTGVAVLKANPGGGLPIGVQVYRSRSGQDCAQAGQARGNRLGILRGTTFHPYAAFRAGPCGNLHKLPFFGDVKQIGDRLIYYGRARSGIVRMRATAAGRTYETPTGSGGAYLFVLPPGSPPPRPVVGIDAGGHVIG